MPATVDILGAERLLRKMTLIPQAMRVQIKAAMADQADEIVEMMRRLAPVHVRSSIGWRWGRRAPDGHQAVATVYTEQRADLTITIFASEWTAHWFEFGTADRFLDKNGKYVGRITAQPFFFVSWRANRRLAKNRIRAAVRKAARQVAAGGGG